MRISVSASSRRGDMAREVAQAVRRAHELPTTLAVDVSDDAKQATLDGARSLRGSLSMSGLRTSLDVVTSTEGGGRDRATLELSATPRGAWAIASGTKAHTVKPKGRALRLANGRFAAVVKHPGTRRVDLWGTATRRAEQDIVRAADQSARANNPFRG